MGSHSHGLFCFHRGIGHWTGSSLSKDSRKRILRTSSLFESILLIAYRLRDTPKNGFLQSLLPLETAILNEPCSNSLLL